GQLSELFGADELDDDTFLRTIGLARAAQRDLDNADPTTLHLLQKYADGVNSFIHMHRENLPIEFTLLGYKPADWQALDTLVWGKVMAYDLGGNYDRELLRSALQQELGAAAMRSLIPDYPVSGPFIIPRDVKSFASTEPSNEKNPALNIGAPNFDKLI